jgi:hypothetical protein
LVSRELDSNHLIGNYFTDELWRVVAIFSSGDIHGLVYGFFCDMRGRCLSMLSGSEDVPLNPERSVLKMEAIQRWWYRKIRPAAPQTTDPTLAPPSPYSLPADLNP